MRATMFAAIYGACGVVVLLLLSIHRWFGPSLPMLIGAVAILVPSVAIVVALERDARPPRPDLMLLVQAVLIGANFGLALPAVWRVASVRSLVLEEFGTTRARELALDDASPRVRVTACAMMFDPAAKLSVEEQATALFARPELATQCLREVPTREAADEVARKLAGLWHATLLAGDERDCEQIEPLDNLPVAASARASLLLDCSLRADDAEVRSCCTSRLLTAYPGDALLETVSEDPELLKVLGTSGFMLAAAMEEEAFVATRGAAAAPLNLDAPAFRQFSVELACRAVTERVDRKSAVAYLRWAFDQSIACLPPAEVGRAVDIPAACEVFLGMDQRRRAAVSTGLCDANLAVLAANPAPDPQARRNSDLGDFADSIDSGRGMLHDSEFSAGSLRAMIDSGSAHTMSAEERAHFSASMGDFARESASEGGPQPDRAEARALERDAESAEGRERMREAYLLQLEEQNADAAKVLGISPEDLAAAAANDGEMSDEMKQRIAEAQEAAAEQP